MFKRLLCAWLLVCAAFAYPSLAAGASFTSAHFRYTYDDTQLTRAQAEAAARDAERAYDDSQQMFPGDGPPEIRCDLTPRFMGATGYAQPDQRPPRVAVRIPDLEYLGLDQAYVLRHEVAHVFSGSLASGPMGEGLADMVAGSFGEQPLAPWWGETLRSAGLWVDPDALFVTGDYPASAELDARQRIARYTEPALLLQFLTKRYGFERVLGFLPDYGRVRRSLESNAIASRRRRFQPPDTNAVKSVFERHFERGWSDLRSDWERQMTAAGSTEADRHRLVLRQKSYAAIRNFEMWLLAQRSRVELQRVAAVRRAFTAVNAAIRSERLGEAEARLQEAQGLVNELKRPMLITRASFRVTWASNLG